MPASPRNRLPGLDLLRCAAIGGVVLSHALQFVWRWAPGAGWMGHFGSFGVDLFFVLSGYLIGGILLRIGPRLAGGRAVLGFWLRRWLRTLPNYWLFLVFNIPFMVWTMKVEHVDLPFGSYVWRSALFVQNFAHRNPPLFFQEAWSLSIEEWFYLILPALLWIGLRFTTRFDRVVLVSAGLMLAVPLALRIAMRPPDSFWEDMRKIVIYRLDAVMYGVLAAWVTRRRPEAVRRLRYVFLAAGLALVVWTYHCFFALDLQHSAFARTWLGSLITLGFAGVLPWAQSVKSLGGRLIEIPIQRIALWSYSMYLCNVPLNALLLHYCSAAADDSAASAWAIFLLYWALTIGLSACVYSLYERHFLRLRESIPLAREESLQGP